jgi:hypothetical protein
MLLGWQPHSQVDRFEAWPPEGGTVTVKLGKTTRKALDLSKPHHLRRLRVPRQETPTGGGGGAGGAAVARIKAGPGLWIGGAEVGSDQEENINI